MTAPNRWQILVLLEALALLVVLGVLLLEEPGAARGADPPAAATEAAGGAAQAARADAGIAPAVTDPAPRVERIEEPMSAGPAKAGGELGIVLAGRVVDQHRAAIDGVWIRFSGPDGRELRTTSDDGSYAIAGLAAGAWCVRAGKTGYADLEEEFRITEKPFAQRHDLQLSASTRIRIRFETPEGELLQAAMQEAGMAHHFRLTALALREAPAGDLPPTDLRAITRTDVCEYESRDGFLGVSAEDLDERYDGLLHVKTALPVYVLALVRHVVLATEPAAAGTEEIVFRIPLEAVQGVQSGLRARFVDATTGAGIPGVRVSGDDSQSSSFGGPSSDSEGRFERLDLRPGLLQVHVFSGNYEDWRGTLLFASGRVHDLGEIALFPQTSPIVRILAPDGTPAANLSFDVALLEVWRSPAPYEGRRHARTDEEGRVTLHRAGRRRYLLTPPGGAWSCVPLLADLRSPPPPGGLTLQLQPGVCVELRTAAAAGSRFVLQTRAGVPVRVVRSLGHEPIAMRLEPGDYFAEVFTPSGRREQPFSIGDAPATIELWP